MNLILPPDIVVNSDNCEPVTEPSDPVITDVDKDYNQDVIQELKNVTGTIRFRVLY